MKSIFLLAFLITSIIGFGQKTKFVTDTLKVYGNCDMCEERIENAVDVVGVRTAEWDVNTKMLLITYSPTKISIEEIHQLCANVGHATSKIKADPEAYGSLHHCCKYVVHDHDHDHGSHGEEGHDTPGCKEHSGCTSAKCSSQN